MSYLLDKKTKKKKAYMGVFLVIIFLILFYFRTGIFKGLSYAGSNIFHPVLVLGDNFRVKFSGIGSFFSSKSSLYSDNQNLKAQLNAEQATMANYNSVLAQNTDLKNILGRKDEKMNMILAAILAKPNQSPYDTLVIDAGAKQGLQTGQTVFVQGNVPIGRVSDVYPDSAKVILFSNPGEKTEVVVSDKNALMEIIGRGGGNFEMILPKDFSVTPGDQVVLPGIDPYVVGIVQTIISDPRDSFTKALLASPVNIQELNFVEVEQ